MTEPDVSVVLAIPSGVSSIDEVLTALEKGCEGCATELLIVCAGEDRSGASRARDFTQVRVELCPAGTLTPVLWGAGLSLARGRIVAFTTDQVRVGPAWARTLYDAIAAGAVGAAGPIDLGPGISAATAAAYFLRFSAFTPEAWPAPAPARDIPGDNAAYKREAVMHHADLLREGFWEVEFHRRFERTGLFMQMVPAARATLVGPVPFRAMAGQRFRHGKEFGISRVRRHGESRAKLLLAAPLVPLVLLVRVGRRALAVRERRRSFVSALPWLGILAASWAVGEATGALLATGGHGGAPAKVK